MFVQFFQVRDRANVRGTPKYPNWTHLELFDASRLHATTRAETSDKYSKQEFPTYIHTTPFSVHKMSLDHKRMLGKPEDTMWPKHCEYAVCQLRQTVVVALCIALSWTCELSHYRCLSSSHLRERFVLVVCCQHKLIKS